MSPALSALCPALLALLAAAAAVPTPTPSLDLQWAAYKVSFGKSYTPEVEVTRRLVWEQNLRYIEQHNLEADRGLHSFRLGENEHADLTSAEFKDKFNGFLQRKDNVAGSDAIFRANPGVSLPDSVDWRSKGYVTPVKNQAQCGSCWAFSATGSLEGQHFRATGRLVSLSEQNLVDCSQKEGNHGCEGGLMDNAFRYIKQNGGIDTEASYPYTAKDGRVCHFNPANTGATVTGFVDVTSGSETDLQAAVASVGPVSVAMDASHPSFQLYKSGVYSERKCSSTQLDHGVLAVGYGTEAGSDYWIVKNSWGETWGLQGYFKLARNENNMCGVATSASYPTVQTEFPRRVAAAAGGRRRPWGPVL